MPLSSICHVGPAVSFHIEPTDVGLSCAVEKVAGCTLLGDLLGNAITDGVLDLVSVGCGDYFVGEVGPVTKLELMGLRWTGEPSAVEIGGNTTALKAAEGAIAEVEVTREGNIAVEVELGKVLIMVIVVGFE